MRKKSISFALAVFLICLQALALGDQTLAQWLNAPKSIQMNIKSNTGKTIIEIDAAVFVPYASKVPVYAVAPRKYNMEELRAMADAAFGQEAYEGDEDFKVQHQTIGPDSTFEHWNRSMVLSSQKLIQTGRADQLLPAAQMYASIMDLPDGSIVSAHAEYDLQQVIGEGYYFANLSAQPLNRQPIGTKVSFDEAKKTADAAVAAFAPGRVLAGAAILKNEIMVKGSAKDASSSSEGFVLYYTLARELPLTYAYGEISKSDFIEPTQSELITVVVDDKGICNLMFNWPHDVTGVLEENAALLSFPQVMDIAGRLLPLKYASWERTYRKVKVFVSDLRLGYMRVPQKQNPRQFQLVPVWDFFGTVNLAGNNTVKWDWAYNSLFTINAMDGTAIDRDYGY